MSTAIKIVDELRQYAPGLLENVVTAIERDAGWRFPEELSTDGQEIIVRIETRYRWLAYEPNSSHAKRGLAGRWQWFNERGAWETVPAPTGLWRQA